MSRQQNLWDTDNAISSPESASGPLRSDSPDGPTTAKSGPALVPVNLSARQAKEAGLLTSGTSGRRSTGLSRSVSLQSSLANRLAATTASLGSTLYSLTWIKRVTPAGHSIPALRASGRPISGSGSIGWPTPTTRDWKDGAECANVPINALLGREVWAAGWPTPTSALADKGVRTEEGALREAMRTSGADLAAMVSMAGWPTPNTPSGGRSVSTDKMDATGRMEDGRKHTASLEHAVKFSGWPTPTVESGDQTVMNRTPGQTGGDTIGGVAKLCGPARLTASGELLIGSDAAMASGGQLHPDHSLWLQLGPWSTAWGNCAARVMRSTSRKPKVLSKP